MQVEGVSRYRFEPLTAVLVLIALARPAAAMVTKVTAWLELTLSASVVASPATFVWSVSATSHGPVKPETVPGLMRLPDTADIRPGVPIAELPPAAGAQVPVQASVEVPAEPKS